MVLVTKRLVAPAVTLLLRHHDPLDAVGQLDGDGVDVLLKRRLGTEVRALPAHDDPHPGRPFRQHRGVHQPGQHRDVTAVVGIHGLCPHRRRV